MQHVGVLTMLVMVLLATASASAQVLSGPWVTRSKQSIDQLRKTDIRIIVLDARGRPVSNVSVHIQQTRQAFPIGFVLPGDHWPDADRTKPVWRCFSAVSLSPVTNWAMLQPEAGQMATTATQPVSTMPGQAPAYQEVTTLLDHARKRAMTVAWGPIISSDVGQEPNWAAALRGQAFRNVAEHYQTQVLTHFGRQVDWFSPFGDTLDHPLAHQPETDEHPRGRGVDLRQLRLLYMKLKTAAPRAMLGPAFDDALVGPRQQQAFARVVAMRQAFIPMDTITLGRHFRHRASQLQLARAMQQWDQLNLPLIVGPLAVGGDDAAQATVNLEMVLRTLFADPHVTGIIMSAVTADQTGDATAALMDAHGEPTSAGTLFDKMFHGLWWTDMHQKTDGLGNIRCRVFAGAYRITAKLPGGVTATATAWIPRQSAPQLIVIQPAK